MLPVTDARRGTDKQGGVEERRRATGLSRWHPAQWACRPRRRAWSITATSCGPRLSWGSASARLALSGMTLNIIWSGWASRPRGWAACISKKYYRTSYEFNLGQRGPQEADRPSDGSRESGARENGHPTLTGEDSDRKGLKAHVTPVRTALKRQVSHTFLLHLRLPPACLHRGPVAASASARRPRAGPPRPFHGPAGSHVLVDRWSCAATRGRQFAGGGVPPTRRPLWSGRGCPSAARHRCQPACRLDAAPPWLEAARPSTSPHAVASTSRRTLQT